MMLTLWPGAEIAFASLNRLEDVLIYWMKMGPYRILNLHESKNFYALKKEKHKSFVFLICFSRYTV